MVSLLSTTPRADERLQERMWIAQRWGWGIFLLVMAVGLSGMLGRGPLSHGRATNAAGTLTADYERVARFGEVTEMRLQYEAPLPLREQDHVLYVDRTMIHFDELTIQPLPIEAHAASGGVEFVLRTAANTRHVEVLLRWKGASSGRKNLHVRLDHETIDGRQWVLP